MKILKSLVIVFAMVAMVAGATSAIFTDEVAVAGNTISSGTLDLLVNGSDTPSAVFAAANMSPGGANGWATAVGAGGAALTNNGSVKGHAWFEIKNIVVTGGDGSLADRIQPVVQLNQAPWGVTYISGVPLNGLNGVRVDVQDIDAGETVNIFAYNLWPDAGTVLDNAAQGQSLTYDVIFHLDQI